MSDLPVRNSVAAADFVALYDRSFRDVYSYVRSRVGERGLAEDLTQEVFLAGAGRAAAGEAVELPWLIAVARNKVVDHWRRQHRRERQLRLVPSREPDPPDHADPLDVSRAEEALGRLNPTYRSALVLRHIDGLPVPEVAHHLGRSVAATEQVLSRARAAFRAAYEEAIDD